MKKTIEEKHSACTSILKPVRDSLDILSGKWKLPIIIALDFGEKRFTEIAQEVHGITDRMLSKELRDRFGPLPPPVELLLAVGELKILASEKYVTAIEVEEDKLKITRHNDFITLGGKFPRLTKKEAKARLKEIKRLLLAI